MNPTSTQIHADQPMPLAGPAAASIAGTDLWVSLSLLFVMCFVCGKRTVEKN